MDKLRKVAALAGGIPQTELALTAGNHSTDSVSQRQQILMPTVIALHPVKNEPRIDSRLIAEHLQIQHKNALAMIEAYQADFQELGVIAFETRKPPKGTTGGRPETFALLNEDQSFLLLSFSRNTKHVRTLKVELVKAFSRFRKHQQSADDYLPFYHELHDEVKALADMAHQNGSLADEKLFHSNFNRLINKAFNINAGMRQTLPPSTKAKITAANVIAADIIEKCITAHLDHKATYQKVKQAVFALAEPLKIEGA